MNLDRSTPPDPYDFLPPVPALRVNSDSVRDGQPLTGAQLGGGAGDNQSPALSWEAGPEGTASYAVSCFDPDAPTPGGVYHWVRIDIPADVLELAAGAAADAPGRPVRNDLGSLQYEGAAPPPGDRAHRYIYVVHALGVASLADVDDSTPAALTGFHVTVNSLARGCITGLA